jgi:hypothetical protein
MASFFEALFGRSSEEKDEIGDMLKMSLITTSATNLPTRLSDTRLGRNLRSYTYYFSILKQFKPSSLTKIGDSFVK